VLLFKNFQLRCNLTLHKYLAYKCQILKKAKKNVIWKNQQVTRVIWGNITPVQALA
jgi:hypothetical protein